LSKGLSAAGIAWAFVSGAEPGSKARYVAFGPGLDLGDPPLVAMGDAPDKTRIPPACFGLATRAS